MKHLFSALGEEGRHGLYPQGGKQRLKTLSQRREGATVHGWGRKGEFMEDRRAERGQNVTELGLRAGGMARPAGVCLACQPFAGVFFTLFVCLPSDWLTTPGPDLPHQHGKGGASGQRGETDLHPNVKRDHLREHHERQLWTESGQQLPRCQHQVCHYWTTLPAFSTPSLLSCPSASLHALPGRQPFTRAVSGISFLPKNLP